jgi:hypothetical protein
MSDRLSNGNRDVERFENIMGSDRGSSREAEEIDLNKRIKVKPCAGKKQAENPLSRVIIWLKESPGRVARYIRNRPSAKVLPCEESLNQEVMLSQNPFLFKEAQLKKCNDESSDDEGSFSQEGNTSVTQGATASVSVDSSEIELEDGLSVIREHLEKEKGDLSPISLIVLGYLYKEGLEEEKNIEGAINLFKEAAEKFKNSSFASMCYKEAADLGDEESTLDYAKLCIEEIKGREFEVGEVKGVLEVLIYCERLPEGVGKYLMFNEIRELFKDKNSDIKGVLEGGTFKAGNA